MEQRKITEQISYIMASDNPLSADVILIEGQEYFYIFDVGNNEQVAEYINTLPKKKCVVLSHFHADHMGNIGRVDFETVYLGANTANYVHQYIPEDALQGCAEGSGTLQSVPRYATVVEPVKLSDGVSVEIYPVPNSHAKGALLLQVNEEYIFIGDSLYSKVDGEDYVYNVQLLKEELELLKSLAGTQVFSSHENRPIKSKAAVLRFLEQIYEKREKNDAYIRVSRK